MGYWWTVFGPIGVTVLLVLVSLPLIERRMMMRRSDFLEVRAQVPGLFPRFRNRT
jgi:steroid 5-alpha reductase family enzyme